MNFLNVRGISKRKGDDFELQQITFTQERFEKIAIAGETGSGKSTLLKIIAGLVQPDEGGVFFEGEKVPGPEEKLLPGHKAIAYLSQHFELRNNYIVEDFLNIFTKLPENETATIYEICKINHLLHRKTNELSGGEKQRIATALLLSASPRLLLLDEPFSNLDVMHKNMMKTVISDIGKKLGISSILVSHDPLDALSWADEILVMKDGQLLQQGTPQQVYQQPVNEYAASLFGKYNLLTAEHARAFHIFPFNNQAGKKMLVRPEGFIFSTDNNGATEAHVQSIKFMGSYYETEVQTGNVVITVTSSIADFAEGEKVCISLQPDFIWYV